MRPVPHVPPERPGIAGSGAERHFERNRRDRLCIGKARRSPETDGMRPERIELSTFGLKGRAASAWQSRLRRLCDWDET
jgi:hypothetical protein